MKGALLEEEAQKEGRCGLPVYLRWGWSSHIEYGNMAVLLRKQSTIALLYGTA